MVLDHSHISNQGDDFYHHPRVHFQAQHTRVSSGRFVVCDRIALAISKLLYYIVIKLKIAKQTSYPIYQLNFKMRDLLISDPSFDTRIIDSKDELELQDNKDELELPDLCSLNSSLSSSSSLYQSCNSSFNNSFKSISSSYSNVNPAFLNSGYFKKKQAKATKKIQAIARGFLVRIQILKAPILAELADIERRKEEELQRVTVQKRAEMEAFQKEMEMEFELIQQQFSETKALVEYLKEETSKYRKENLQLKQECKALKKGNKQLLKDGKKDSGMKLEVAMMEQQVANLERNQASGQNVADKYVKKISAYKERIQEADEAIAEEQLHTERLKHCISGAFTIVECRSDRLANKLLKIMDTNKVFL